MNFTVVWKSFLSVCDTVSPGISYYWYSDKAGNLVWAGLALL